jgi:glycosyltransferase involved in cell wall biosynthesis
VVASQAAVAGLDKDGQQAVLVREDVEEQAQAILQVLGDANLCSQMGVDGRKYVQTRHDWGLIAEKLTGYYRSGASKENQA